MNQKSMVELIRSRGVKDEQVLNAMERVPREAFVPGRHSRSAYGDYALPIGHQQTISQPYIVALMTEALELQPGNRVLEVGTGSGYQAAVLAEMGMEVYTIERIPELQEAAAKRLENLGYDVHCKQADGYEGWSEFAPYDGIIVTAAAPEIPEPLIEQLADGGTMIIPVGHPGSYQTLWKVVKEGKHIRKINLGGVAFVPFISRELGTGES
ncbi:MAG: protein-L-isoaspartate(D-aspartate) O-methyltransferase [Anaerolineae bacterium]